MALVAFLRGINVGGHKTFRPSLLALELRELDVENIGAAGTLVVRKPVSRARLLAALRGKLPFETKVMICEGRELLRLEQKNPFAAVPVEPDQVRFVSILERNASLRPSLPLALPPAGEWLLRILARDRQFVFGIYRRRMKTIGYLGRLDQIFGAPATTRNWNTIAAAVKRLKNE